jgi:anti-sigma regulatory factor (Ser/Thr protein kinase)
VVGGWSDALELADGRVAVVVGDVVGHGLRAAATMGKLRNAFRAYALTEGEPAAVMTRVNRLVTGAEEDVMATALLLVLDRETRELTYASAGHPPPLVLDGDGVRFLEEGRSVPVGAAELTQFREGRATLSPGATVLLYTDGLIERRDVPLERRLEQLATAAQVANRDLERLCDGVLAGVLGAADPADDVALLAIRPEAPRADSLVLSPPADPSALSGLRRRLGGFLTAAGADSQEAFEITLAVCEAAGNAIEHAYGPGDAAFELEAELEAGEVVATVRDRGSWRDPRSGHRGRGLKIIEGLMDSVDVSAEPDGTVVRMRRRLRAGSAA